MPEIERHGPIEAWIIDDTGFSQAGTPFLLVSHGSMCGQLGSKITVARWQCRCRLPTTRRDLPVAYQLYLPQEWAQDRARRRKVGVPEDISFKTKPQIAFEQIRKTCERGLPRGVVLMDAGYGANTDLRTAIAALGLKATSRGFCQTRRYGSRRGATASQTLVGSRPTTQVATA